MFPVTNLTNRGRVNERSEFYQKTSSTVLHRKTVQRPKYSQWLQLVSLRSTNTTSFASTKPIVRLLSPHVYQVTVMRKKVRRTYCMCSEQYPTAEHARGKTLKYMIGNGHTQNTNSHI